MIYRKSVVEYQYVRTKILVCFTKYFHKGNRLNAGFLYIKSVVTY